MRISTSGLSARYVLPQSPLDGPLLMPLLQLVFSVCWCAINVLFALVVRRPLHPAIALCSDFIAFGAILTFGILIHFKINARGPGSKCTVDDCAAKLHKLYIVERSGEVISLVAA